MGQASRVLRIFHAQAPLDFRDLLIVQLISSFLAIDDTQYRTRDFILPFLWELSQFFERDLQ